jgi:GDP dissociation inhibitor
MSELESEKTREPEEEEEGAPAPRSFDWLPAGTTPLADGEYDAIVMGTGLTECIISGLLSVNGEENRTPTPAYVAIVALYLAKTRTQYQRPPTE